MSKAKSGDPENNGSFTWFLVKVAVIVLLFRSFVFAPFTIPSESMLPGLLHGDYLIAAKWPYGYSRHSLPFGLPLIPGRIFANSPARGDIVIFKHPLDESDYIKRVIGVPGDTVSMRGGQVVLDGRAIPRARVGDFVIAPSPNASCVGARRKRSLDVEGQCRYAMFNEQMPSGKSFYTVDFGRSPQDDYGPVSVPEGMIFVMGDNRDNSQDSRFPLASGGGVGLVDQTLLVGRAELVAISVDGSAKWYNPISWANAIRWDRIGLRI